MKTTSKKIYQAFAALIALVVIAIGLGSLLGENSLFYGNWWGALVFAPITVLVGGFFLYLVICKWDKILANLSSRH